MLKIYNTMTNKLEEFKAIEKGKVSMYVCGPTVYNYIHIGNARPAIFFDVVYRYFIKKGYDVKFISNFTDIDDKIVAAAIEEEVSEKEIADKYIKAYLEDIDKINCLPVNIRCKVTDYMGKITEFLKLLYDKGYAYQVGEDLYFDIRKLKEYGELSNQDISSLIAGQRINVNDKKKYAADFTLWKNPDKGIKFESDFGIGRPGWHTECIVMIKELTGGMVDIHGGGQDLIFPHHENEIAQSLAYDSTKLANYWMHNGMLNINNEKMSKSLKNTVLVKDFVDKHSANVLRLALLHGQYRQLHSITDDLLESCHKMNERFETTYKSLILYAKLNNITVEGKIDKVLETLENDFNTPTLITFTNEKLKEVNKLIRGKSLDSQTAFYFVEAIWMLGLKYDIPNITDDDVKMYNKWEMYRKNKEFEKADEIRSKLVERGIL